ncbi:hypothetical protein D3C71_1473480 [compost metagenome]
MAHQADHLAGADIQIQPLDDCAAAVAKAHALHGDRALNLVHLHGLGRIGHVAHMVQDVEDALGASGGLLRDRDNAAH